jgi:hypothetical protein
LATVEAAELKLKAVSVPAVPGSGRPLATRLVLAGACAAFIAATVQTTCHLVDAFVLAGRYPALEADAQGNVFDWVSAMAILAAAAAALACSERSSPHLPFRVLGVLLGYLAIDELVGIHEKLGAAIATHLPGALGSLGDRIMPVVYLPLVGSVFALLWIFPGGHTRGRSVLRIGLGLLAGAVLIRLAAAGVKLADGQVNGSVRPIGVALDQGLQLAAWILVATGLAAQLPMSMREE